jgi:hypothetical protein
LLLVDYPKCANSLRHRAEIAKAVQSAVVTRLSSNFKKSALSGVEPFASLLNISMKYQSISSIRLKLLFSQWLENASTTFWVSDFLFAVKATINDLVNFLFD